MGIIVGTCGHEIDDEWFSSGESNYRVKYIDREGHKGYAQITTCQACRRDNARHKLILSTQQQIDAWLKNKNPRAVAY